MQTHDAFVVAFGSVLMLLPWLPVAPASAATVRLASPGAPGWTTLTWGEALAGSADRQPLNEIATRTMSTGNRVMNEYQQYHPGAAPAGGTSCGGSTASGTRR